MKKYIFTESQIKNIVDVVINEHLISEQSPDGLRLHDIAEILSRTGNDYQTLLEVLQDVLSSEGHEGVAKFVNQGSRGDFEIEYIGHNLYHYKIPKRELEYEKNSYYRNSD